MPIELLATVVAKGVPALLIILGFSVWAGFSFVNTLFGISAGNEFGGILLMALGVGIYVLEIFA